MSFNQIKK